MPDKSVSAARRMVPAFFAGKWALGAEMRNRAPASFADKMVRAFAADKLVSSVDMLSFPGSDTRKEMTKSRLRSIA